MIDGKDIEVLRALRENSRAKFTEISEGLGLPVATVFEKVRRLRKRAISRCVCIVDFERLGFAIRANFVLKVEERNRESLKALLVASKNINSVFRTNNGYDFFAEAVFQNIRQLDLFCEQLDSVKAKRKMHLVVDDIKREGFCPAQ